MSEVAETGKTRSVLTEAATMAGLASALGGITAVILPEIPLVAVVAAAVGALGGFLAQKFERR
jgi:hypothetical protein